MLPADVIALADPVVVNESEMARSRIVLVPESLLVTFGAAGARWDGVDGARPVAAADSQRHGRGG